MQKIENWEQVEAATGEFKGIEPGAYVCRILQATEEFTRTGKSQLVILFDVVEGEYANFYAEQHAKKSETNPDAKWQGIYRQLTEGNSVKFFKGTLSAIEKSNPGYQWDWDEKKLRGKKFLGVFGKEEYLNNNDEVKTSTKCRFIRSTDQINDIKIPDVKKLKQPDNYNGLGTAIPEEEIPWG